MPLKPTTTKDWFGDVPDLPADLAAIQFTDLTELPFVSAMLGNGMCVPPHGEEHCERSSHMFSLGLEQIFLDRPRLPQPLVAAMEMGMGNHGHRHGTDAVDEVLAELGATAHQRLVASHVASMTIPVWEAWGRQTTGRGQGGGQGIAGSLAQACEAAAGLTDDIATYDYVASVLASKGLTVDLTAFAGHVRDYLRHASRCLNLLDKSVGDITGELGWRALLEARHLAFRQLKPRSPGGQPAGSYAFLATRAMHRHVIY